MKYCWLLKIHLLLALLCVISIEESSELLHKKLSSADKEPTWTCPPEESVMNSNESNNWHTFLNHLFCTISEYEIQTAKRNYENNSTIDFEKEDREIKELIDEIQGAVIQEKNFETFLNKTVESNLTDCDSIKNIEVTEIKIKELNEILNVTLRDKLQIDCEETHVYIKGHFVTMADVINILLSKTKLTDIKCKNILLTDKTKFVSIFALNTFFIDSSLNSSFIHSQNITLMSVIAPKWENIGKNKIDLKGEDAGSPAAGNGIDGEPGKPGNPGGNFFGIGSEFVNGINLEISVKGGDGSRGREGKKGRDGTDGETPTMPSSGKICFEGHCKKQEQRKINDYDCKILECYYSHQGPFVPIDIYNGCKYEIFGRAGTKGQKGGDGGKGGKGGYPGNIELIELKDHSQISLFKSAGNNGADGKGGAGGLGGRKGNDIHVSCMRVWKESCNLVDTKTNDERAESGQKGLDGGNTRGMVNPKLPIVINDLDKAKVINRYKNYLRENLNGRLTAVFLNDTLNDLENNLNVKKVYNILGLIDELQHLEKQYDNLQRDIDFIPFYQSLLNRISEYAYAPKEVGDPRQYKNVLCYLYTATLSRIYNIQDKMESNLIVDIYAYLSSVKNDIEKLTDLKNAKYKETLINKYKDEYKHQIDIKINEAKELILKEIAPEIQNIGTEIETQMETLINEVIYLEEQTEKEHEVLMKKQQQLGNILGLQGLFSVLKIFGTVVSFLGPVGAVAGSVIETGSVIANSFVTDKASDPYKGLELPQSVWELQSINNKIRSIINQRITCLENSLEGISLEIIKNPDVLSSMSFKILSIKGKLDKLDKERPNLKEIQTLQKELDTVLQNQEEESDPKNEKQLKSITNLKRIVQISTLLVDSYSNYKNNQAKLDAISKAIEQNENNLKKLKQYEEKIYNSIIPMLQNVQNDLQNIIAKLGTKSKVALDLTKWHVDSTLKDMTSLMHQLTRGFKVEDNLARCLQKLKEAMDALINVHQHIQDYQKDQNLANYIAEISSVTATDIIVANNAVFQDELRNAVRNLEITVRSNIVLQRYKIAMSAFKQFVFPFAHNYYKELILPSHLAISDEKSNSTLEDLVFKASVEIEKINSKLEDYKNTVTSRDGCIGVGGFQSGYVSSKPFFVWKNEQHSDMISKLLSGNAVRLKADVRNSALDKDAIKFNVVDFNFKSKNETLQAEINNKLKGFQITVYHLGNSDYRYESKIYEMMTGSQEMWYYFEKKENGEPMYYSLSYKKIMQGNVTLSPYASWKVKLDNVTEDITFKDLEIYKNSVDLTLEGYGYFLNKRSKNCIDLMVDKYYKPISTLSYADSNFQLHAKDNQYPLQNDVFKRFEVFKGFL